MIASSAKKDSLISFLLICVSFFLIFPFLFLSFLLIVLARISSTSWKAVVRENIPTLFLILVGKRQILTIKYVSCTLFVDVLYQIWGAYSIPSMLRVFMMNGYWILSNAFSASIDIIMWFFFFSQLMWWITLIDFQILNQLCISGINPTWLWCIVLFIRCWIWLANILLRIFASIFMRDIDL